MRLRRMGRQASHRSRPERYPYRDPASLARFKDLVAEEPMAYATRWRMQLAVTWLRESEAELADLPRRLGYSSEAAFSRAFERTIGVPPGPGRRRP